MENGKYQYSVSNLESFFPLNTVNIAKLIYLGRETFLVPVTWEDGWPIINGGQKVALDSAGPGLYQLEHPSAWRDDFSKPELSLGWYRKSRIANALLKTLPAS